MSVNNDNKYLIVKPILNKDGCCIAQEVIDSIPSADAVPVRHGRWIEKAFRIMCSDCGAEFKDEILYMIGNDEQMSYCPNCGARMDGDSDEID